MWDNFKYMFRPHTPLRHDFIEVMTQVLHAMMNHHPDVVLSLIGTILPETYRLSDDGYQYDEIMLERLQAATRELAEAIIGQFYSIGFFNSDGTIAYVMKRDHGDVVLLERISLPF